MLSRWTVRKSKQRHGRAKISVDNSINRHILLELWRAAQLQPGSALGLLTVEPMSGYDLGQSIRTSIGFFWNESYDNLSESEAAGGRGW